jgi:uncharacterized protein (TIGR02452 family)
LDEPWLCSFITAAAPNADAAHSRSPASGPAVLAVFEERIHKVLTIARIHGHPAIVLGAWGCGAFGNNSEDVAPLFAKALEGPFRGVFSHVVFAVTDWSDEKKFIGPFEKAFGAAS